MAISVAATIPDMGFTPLLTTLTPSYTTNKNIIIEMGMLEGG